MKKYFPAETYLLVGNPEEAPVHKGKLPPRAFYAIILFSIC